MRQIQRIFTALLFIILIPVIGNAQDIRYARSLIDSLCSPGFFGRGYAFRGDSIAAGFIRSRFIQSGLKPLAKDYYQSFPISVNLFPGDMLIRINHNRLIPGKDFIVDPDCPSIKGKYPFITLSENDLTSKPALFSFLNSSDGKVILINESLFPGKRDSLHRAMTSFAEALAETTDYHPAAIFLAGKEKLIWSTGTSVAERPLVFMNKIPKAATGRISMHIDEKYDSIYVTHNIIGMIPAREGLDSAIVLTAHYDHLGMMGKSTRFPGANDNASGTALILDLAKELYKARDSLRYPVVIISFAGEEAGLLGSRYYVEHPLFDLHKIKFLINLDLAGTGDDGITVVNATVFKHEFNLMKSINEQYHLLPAVNSRGTACNSDHCFFYQAGVPCFFIYTLGGIQAYHDIYDRPETLPLTAYNNYFRLLKYFILQIDGNRP